MDEMTPGHRRAGRMVVTPKAAEMIEGDASRTEDEKFLEARPSADFLQTDPWRTLRILSEFVEGFDAMAKVGPAVTVFGSARTKPDDPTTECVRISSTASSGSSVSNSRSMSVASTAPFATSVSRIQSSSPDQ